MYKYTNNVETLNANLIQDDSYVSGTSLNAMMYYSGGRIWYSTVLPYKVIGSLVQTTEVKQKKDSAISTEIVNRFLDVKHVKELKHYIVQNKDNFTIPPITLVSKTKIIFKPITFNLEKFENIEEVYEIAKKSGSILGKIIIPLGYTFTCLDGNHRSKAIAELSGEYPEAIDESYMLCNIVYETDNLRIRQDFVDINQNAKTTTATINTLFDSRDPLSRLTSQTIDNIEYLNENVEILASSISKSSKKLYTLNNIKNVIVELANYNSQNRSSINNMSDQLKDPDFLADLSLEIDVFFDILKQNNIIRDFLNAQTLEEKSYIRSNSLITSGIGLLISARVVSSALKLTKKKCITISIGDIIKKVFEFNWSRSNEFFIGKILSSEGTIISSVNSIKSTSNALLEELFGSNDV